MSFNKQLKTISKTLGKIINHVLDNEKKVKAILEQSALLSWSTAQKLLSLQEQLNTIRSELGFKEISH